MRIVITEDELRIREGIHKLLDRTDDDFDVVGEAENGREGAQLILREKPDLVIADVRMPEMDGIEMIRVVQEQGLSPVVIVLSAYSDFSYAQRAMKLGVREYLVKPVMVDELISAVRRAQETLKRQNLSKHGLRTRAQVLSSALYGDDAFSGQVRAYAAEHLNLSAQTDFALLLIHPVSPQAQLDGRIAQGLEAIASCTMLSPTAQGDIPFVLTDFAQQADMPRQLEKHLLTHRDVLGDFVAILGHCTGLDALHPLHQALVEHLPFGLLCGDGRLLHYPEIARQTLELFSYPIELENAARQALTRRDAKSAAARIAEFGRLFQLGIPYAPRDIKEAYIRFTWALLFTARELGYAKAERYSRQALLERIMSAVHPAQLKLLGEELTQVLTEDRKKHSETGLLVHRAQTLMKQYYAQGITLDEIAQRLSVTPEYLGTQIHRELGVTFGTLMKTLRVERAKELLLSSDKKLYEIAEMVGYADAKYFSKVFQSIAKMTPAEYRRLNK